MDPRLKTPHEVRSTATLRRPTIRRTKHPTARSQLWRALDTRDEGPKSL